jgi:hypothetical protein
MYTGHSDKDYGFSSQSSLKIMNCFYSQNKEAAIEGRLFYCCLQNASLKIF